MHAIYRCLILATVVLVAGCGAALAAVPHAFALPDHGTLTMVVPDGWKDAVTQPPNRLPPTISLTPASGTAFEVRVTAFWPMGPSAETTDETTLRARVSAAAKSAESQSVEHPLTIKELSGANGRGYYFSATDRAPNPGEYKFMMQGMIRTGDIALAFTVLTNDGQDAVLKAVLEMLRTASSAP